MTSSYLSEAEWQAAFVQFGVQQALSYNVAELHMLRVRRNGGTMIDGQAYYYIECTDELIRGDVIKWVERRRADEVIAARESEKAGGGVQQGTSS